MDATSTTSYAKESGEGKITKTLLKDNYDKSYLPYLVVVELTKDTTERYSLSQLSRKLQKNHETLKANLIAMEGEKLVSLGRGRSSRSDGRFSSNMILVSPTPKTYEIAAKIKQ